LIIFPHVYILQYILLLGQGQLFLFPPPFFMKESCGLILRPPVYVWLQLTWDCGIVHQVIRWFCIFIVKVEFTCRTCTWQTSEGSILPIWYLIIVSTFVCCIWPLFHPFLMCLLHGQTKAAAVHQVSSPSVHHCDGCSCGGGAEVQNFDKNFDFATVSFFLGVLSEAHHPIYLEYFSIHV
jgi:hypothetical protein